MKRRFLVLLVFLCLFALCACDEKPQGKPGRKELSLSELVLQQKGKSSNDYNVEFEALHAHLYSAVLEEENLTVVVVGDAESTSLTDGRPVHRLEAHVNVLLNGMEETMTLKDFTAALPQDTKEAFSTVDIGAGSAYYVAEADMPYAIVRFDSDGNGAYDIHMDIVLTEENKVEPDALAWLYFEEETN